jgi:hypothetical protein
MVPPVSPRVRPVDASDGRFLSRITCVRAGFACRERLDEIAGALSTELYRLR